MTSEQPLNLKAKLSVLFAGLLLLTSSIGILNPVIAHADATTQNIAKISFTFDDGLTSADTQAAPTLAQYGYTGTDYIITNCVGMSTTPNTCAADADNSYMTWDQISDLHTKYGWEIGSHTVDHPLTAAVDNPGLTDQQLDTEMSASQLVLNAKGYAATDFASPYGDYDNRSLAVIAKYYNSHRTFQDYVQPTAAQDTVTPTFPYYSPRNVYPYNPVLIPIEEVQGNISVATVEGYINTAITNKQWLVLVFHEIKASGASTAEADYQYNAADLGAIAAYVKSKSLPVVSMNDGLPTGTNLLANSSFNDGIADGWTTDYTAGIVADKQNTSFAGHGAYDGTTTGALNSIAVNTTAATGQSHLFSPQVSVTAGTTYTLENFVNVTSTKGGVNYYVDSYDAAGNYITTQKAVGPVGSTEANNVQVGDVNFTYTPAAGTAFARVYADIAPATTGYLDNMRFLGSDGSVVVTPPPVDTTAPVVSTVASTGLTTSGATITWKTDEASTSQVSYGTTTAYGSSTTLDSTLATTHSVTLSGLTAGTTYHYEVISKDAAGNTSTPTDYTFTTTTATPALKAGDANGDGVVNIKDATLVSVNWNKTGATRAQGDLNGDGVVNIKDATLVSVNWGK